MLIWEHRSMYLYDGFSFYIFNFQAFFTNALFYTHRYKKGKRLYLPFFAGNTGEE